MRTIPRLRNKNINKLAINEGKGEGSRKRTLLTETGLRHGQDLSTEESMDFQIEIGHFQTHSSMGTEMNKTKSWRKIPMKRWENFRFGISWRASSSCGERYEQPNRAFVHLSATKVISAHGILDCGEELIALCLAIVNFVADNIFFNS